MRDYLRGDKDITQLQVDIAERKRNNYSQVT